jgi:sphingolipid 4-desaturase/C4-monooxygenase
MTKAHPEILKLVGHYWPSFFIVLGLCSTMGATSYLLKSASWPLIILMSWFFGAFVTHSLFVMVHEAAHNLIFKSSWANKLVGIFCNIPQVLPSAIAFRTYHLLHHLHFGELDTDADLAFHWEAKWVGNSWWRKSLWLCCFMIVEAIRPMKLTKGKLFCKWTILNIVVVLGANALIFWGWGAKSFTFLLMSSIFAIGPHIVGARWIQEHYTMKEGQETYSYYGPLNFIQFNIGYHNEHHDLFRVPWIHLPKLKAMAPEFYEDLYYHKSWTGLLIKFLFSKDLSLYSRIVRLKKSSGDSKSYPTYQQPKAPSCEEQVTEARPS